MKEQTPTQLKAIIQGCKEGRRDARAEMYKQFYNYAMSVCLRYSRDREEAKDIVNEGFIKIFTHIDKYSEDLSFRGWLRRVMVNKAIDYYRRTAKHQRNIEIEEAHQLPVNTSTLSQISEKEIMEAVQQLPPSYRYVFNLYVVEGYKHQEIADQMGISLGTSKSNLSKARDKLKLMLRERYSERYESYG